MSNLVCKCGHKESEHDRVPLNRVTPKSCFAKNGSTHRFPDDYADNCYAFEPDNLSYMLMQYEKKNKTKAA